MVTLTLLIGLTIPSLVQEGMFVDGVTYSAISKNLANGYGTLWEPHYTMTLYPQFFENPPLVFWVQSAFFRLLGDEQKLRDVYTLSEHLPEGTILSTNSALWSDWYLVAYLSRVGYLSLDDREGHEYYLIQKDASSDIPIDYELLDVPMNRYLLLKRRHATPPIRPKPQ